MSSTSGSTGVTIGIDIGTTSVKALAVDGDGSVLARARIPHRLNGPASGAFEHEVDVAWNDDVVAALATVSEGIDVAAVNVAAMVPSLAAVDRSGRALSPGLLYGDHRGITDENRPDEPGDAGELVAFLTWLTEHAPDAAGYWPAQAVANHALCGVGAIDTMAALTAMPLFDGRRWDPQQAATAGASVDQLPIVTRGSEPAGHVREGLPAAGALVGGGTIDALGEQIVAGTDQTGDVLVICGTTLITWAVMDEWQTVPGLWTIPHTAPGKVLIGGPSNAGGLFIDQVHRWLGVPPEQETGPAPSEDPPVWLPHVHGERVARRGSKPSDDLPVWLPYVRGERMPQHGSAPSAESPVWLPYVRGERVPLHRRDLRAELHDAALHHDVEHLRRAAYEATGFVVRHQLDLASTAVSSPRRIVATGGGTRSAEWMQALADTTGLPVDVVAVPEGAALGAAFMARCTAGLEQSITDASRWARTARRVEPDANRQAAADVRYRRFRELTDDAVER